MYKRVAIFIGCFALFLFLVLGFSQQAMNPAAAWIRAAFSALAFIVGGSTSIFSGLIGMKIATFANARTTIGCAQGWTAGFNAAFKAGGVMGFSLCGMAILVLQILLYVFNGVTGIKSDGSTTSAQILMECIAGYGLGGSAVALFGRVGGGIYTKAADVGADLVGKVESNIPEDHPNNAAVIADNVGDNVGDIAGMGADLFGSLAESSCAALVIGAAVPELARSWSALSFPLVISALGLLVCWVSSYVATHIKRVTKAVEVEKALKWQLMITTVVLTPLLLGAAVYVLPSSFTLKPFDGGPAIVSRNYQAFLCIASGLWAGLAIGYYTEYMTSKTYTPVQELVSACEEGAAVNIIQGLALGQASCVVSVLALAASVLLSFKLCLMYGVALAALGMLSTLATGLTIDAYGPISDNAGGIATMSGLDKGIRKRTDELDAAGNTTAAIGKGFAIGSAALVSLALFGGFVTSVQFTYAELGVTSDKHGINGVDILRPIVFTGLLVGAMLPYWFSAMTMKSVGKAAREMVIEVRRQFQLQRERRAAVTGVALVAGSEASEMDWTDFEPDYATCINISTRASLREMVAPGALVLFSPIVGGTLLGIEFVMGLLAGALVSGVQMAISSSNSGGAWDNCKKSIEGQKEAAEERQEAGEDMTAEIARLKKLKNEAVVGDTVGDPLKDTSGPALNILMKLMAIVSLVFAPFFVRCSLAQFYGLQYRIV